LLAHGQDPDLSHPRYPALATIAIPRFLTIASTLTTGREDARDAVPPGDQVAALKARDKRRRRRGHGAAVLPRLVRCLKPGLATSPRP
jgi:hypothetical protein